RLPLFHRHEAPVATLLPLRVDSGLVFLSRLPLSIQQAYLSSLGLLSYSSLIIFCLSDDKRIVIHKSTVQLLVMSRKYRLPGYRLTLLRSWFRFSPRATRLFSFYRVCRQYVRWLSPSHGYCMLL